MDADKTDVLEAGLIAAQLHAVAERGIGAAVKPVPRLETGITRRFARFGAAEERLKGSVQAAHRSLRGREVQAGEIRIRLPLLFEPAALIGVLHRVPMRLVFIAALLQAGIVKPAMRFERDLDRARLVGVWLQAVFERAKHNLIIMVSAVLVQGSAGEKGRRKRIPLSPEGDSPLRLNSMDTKQKLYRVYVGPGKNHRVIYQIRDEVLLVLVVKVGDRKEVYRRVK